MREKQIFYELVQKFVNRIFGWALANIQLTTRDSFTEGQLLSYYETLDSLKNDLYSRNIALEPFGLAIDLDVFFFGNHSLIPDESMESDPLQAEVDKENIQVCAESLNFFISRIKDNAREAFEQKDGSAFNQGRIHAYFEIVESMKKDLLVLGQGLSEQELEH